MMRLGMAFNKAIQMLLLCWTGSQAKPCCRFCAGCVADWIKGSTALCPLDSIAFLASGKALRVARQIAT